MGVQFISLNQTILSHGSLSLQCKSGRGDLSMRLLSSPCTCNRTAELAWLWNVYTYSLLYPPFLVCVMFLACHPYISFHFCLFLGPVLEIANPFSYMWSEHYIKCNHSPITWKAVLAVVHVTPTIMHIQVVWIPHLTVQALLQCSRASF